MKIVNDIISDLREKPILGITAILLVAALIVLPMRLGKPADPPPPEAVPTAAIAQDAGPALTLTRAATTGFERAPRVNTHATDPFGERTRTQSKAAEKALKKQLAALIDSITGGSTTGSSDGGSTVPSGDGGGVVPEVPSEDPSPTPAPSTGEGEEETDDLLSIMVANGDATPTAMTNIRTLSPLPDATNPFLVYTGKSSTGGAVFIVSADVQPTGDGKCDPSPEDCRTLTLDEGQTETFKLLTQGGATVTITIVGVETGKVAVSGTAARAARLEAKARKVGAGVVKDALDDPSILKSLVRHKVHFRH